MSPVTTNERPVGADANASPRPVPPPLSSTRARVRSLLLAVVLIPTLAMVVLTAASASETWARRQASVTVEHDARRLEAMMVMRAHLTREEVDTLALMIGAELGVPAARLNELYGIDFESRLEATRAAVDADPTLRLDPALDGERARLQSLRAMVDGGTGTSDEAALAFVQLGADIDGLWSDEFDRLDRTMATAPLPGEFGVRLEDVEHAHAAFVAGLQRTRLVIAVLDGDTSPETARQLLEADTRFQTRADELDRRLGPAGGRAWSAFTIDAAVQGFEATTEDAIETALTGVASPATANPADYGNALFDGVGWSSALIEVVGGASADLSAIGIDQEADAARDFRFSVAFAVFLTAVSFLAAASVSRSMSRPLKELASNARSIREGRFDLDPLDPRGPKEIADTAAAFNEMVVALAAVESRAVAMAGDPEADQPVVPIPGRTGEALDRAFGILHESIRNAEASRASLHELATHDGMTGLLNRSAAMDAITRDLERVRRDGGSVVVLFIDVDGLKSTNDVHGHDAGDDLIRLTADTLRSATRSTDVVARLGGDEFLVASTVGSDGGSVESAIRLTALADRLEAAISGAALHVGDTRIRLRASIGIAVSEPGEVTADTVIRRADAAMYRAKGDPTTSIARHDGFGGVTRTTVGGPPATEDRPWTPGSERPDR